MFNNFKRCLVILIVVLPGCKKNSEKCPAPASTVVSSNHIVIYEGASLSLGTGASASNSYSWTGPGGWTSNQAIAVRDNMQAQDAGIYSVKVYDLNNCQAFTGSRNIQVSPPPDAPCALPNNIISSSSPTIGNYAFPTGTSAYPYQSAYIYTLTAANSERLDIYFSGSHPPYAGLYKTVLNQSTAEDFVYFVINKGSIQYRSKGNDEVYVNKAAGKMVLTFCNLTMSEFGNPSNEIILTGKVSPF